MDTRVKCECAIASGNSVPLSFPSQIRSVLAYTAGGGIIHAVMADEYFDGSLRLYIAATEYSNRDTYEVLRGLNL